MDMAKFDAAADSLPDICFERPVHAGLLLGSGWDVSPTEGRTLARVSYADIPCLGASTVKGHAGEFILWEDHGRRIAAWRGRRHLYEGVGWESVTMPVELLRRMGCGKLLVTNAAGGINPALRPGDFAIVRDHINTCGANPLAGPHRPEWGERFPDLASLYSRRLSELLHAGANRLGLRAMDAVYAWTPGPCYETPAEVRAWKAWGADVVGMSTVPEATFAKACGMEVAALSFVANLAAGISLHPPCHEDVVAAAAAARPAMAAYVADFLSRI